MKCLQTILVAGALSFSAAAAHAAASESAHAESLMSNSYAQQDAPRNSIRPGDSRNANDAADQSVHSEDSSSAAGRLPASSGKSADPSPIESSRTPSWQSLLPGSIQ